jgi:hypothetical protein
MIVMVIGYTRSRDPLHPVVFLTPLFFLGMVLDPARTLMHPDIERYFPNLKGLGFAMLVQYLGMAAFFIGILSIRSVRRPLRVNQSLIDPLLTVSQRSQLRTLAWIIAGISLAAYWSGIWNVGGFIHAYSRHKGGGRSISGYLGEASNLGLVALVIYSLSIQLRRLKLSDVVAAVVMVSPVLLSGTLGGRRGPLFLSLAMLFVAYWIARGRVPRPWVTGTTFATFVVAIVFIQSQRQHLHLGSNQGIRWQRFSEVLRGEEIGPGDNFIASSGAVIALQETGEFHYGRRFVVTYLVRPIPRHFWPTKYDDATAILYGRQETFRSVTNRHQHWQGILGWHPPVGFAVNAIVDLFMEFSWGFVLATFALGRFIGFCWRKFRTDGGIWFVIYVSIAALSIYLPTQSLSAFMHRFLYLSVMTAIFWKLFVRRSKSNRTRPEFQGSSDNRHERLFDGRSE